MRTATDANRRTTRRTPSHHPSSHARPHAHYHAASAQREHQDRSGGRDRKRGAPLNRLQRLVRSRRRLRLVIWKASSGRCVYCGDKVSLDRVTIDHVIPRCRGGEDSPENCVPACFECNQAKGARSLDEFVTEHPSCGRNFIRLARTVARNVRRSARRALSLALA